VGIFVLLKGELKLSRVSLPQQLPLERSEILTLRTEAADRSRREESPYTPFQLCSVLRLSKGIMN
jgi:hypothetical protein